MRPHRYFIEYINEEHFYVHLCCFVLKFVIPIGPEYVKDLDDPVEPQSNHVLWAMSLRLPCGVPVDDVDERRGPVIVNPDSPYNEVLLRYPK